MPTVSSLVLRARLSPTTLGERQLAQHARMPGPGDAATSVGFNHSKGRNSMYAKTLAAAVLVVGALLGSDRAGAQTVAAVEQVMVGVSTQTRQLDTALANLGEISKGLHGTEGDSADVVANAGRQFSGAVGEATPVGVIFRHMKNPEDKRFTRTMLAISASKALLVADSDIKLISRALPQIVTPAAAAESAKVRDAIVVTRNLLETFALTAKSPARPQAPNT
jgi:hypothetical protein